jgi:hypothetical protein
MGPGPTLPGFGRAAGLGRKLSLTMAKKVTLPGMLLLRLPMFLRKLSGSRLSL